MIRFDFILFICLLLVFKKIRHNVEPVIKLPITVAQIVKVATPQNHSKAPDEQSENNDGIIMPAGLVYSPGFSGSVKRIIEIINQIYPGRFSIARKCRFASYATITLNIIIITRRSSGKYEKRRPAGVP
jgi:hypothetical protein